MPHFTLDLVWTDKGREDFHSGRFLRTRNIAIDIARQNNLNIVSITDRLAPTPVGPVWVVEGQEKDVKAVVDRWNNEPNVTARIV